MSWAALAGAAVALGSVAFVLSPLLRRETVEREAVASNQGERQELYARQEMALAALKDLEDDRQTGKIDEADYRELEAALSSQAMEIMNRLDRLEAEFESGPSRGGPIPLRPDQG